MSGKIRRYQKVKRWFLQINSFVSSVSLYLETWHYFFLSTIMNYALSQQQSWFMFVGFEFEIFDLAVGIDRQSVGLNDETDSMFEFTN